MWRDGTSHLLFEPVELLEKLAAITPRPAINLLLYHGILAPHARWRSRVLSHGRPAPDSNARELEARPGAASSPGAWTWAALMRRVFDLDVLACTRCGGRLRVIATVQDPAVVRTILDQNLAPREVRMIPPFREAREAGLRDLRPEYPSTSWKPFHDVRLRLRP
jgi:hypothetical protein